MPRESPRIRPKLVFSVVDGVSELDRRALDRWGPPVPHGHRPQRPQTGTRSFSARRRHRAHSVHPHRQTAPAKASADGLTGRGQSRAHHPQTAIRYEPRLLSPKTAAEPWPTTPSPASTAQSAHRDQPTQGPRGQPTPARQNRLWQDHRLRPAGTSEDGADQGGQIVRSGKTGRDGTVPIADMGTPGPEAAGMGPADAGTAGVGSASEGRTRWSGRRLLVRTGRSGAADAAGFEREERSLGKPVGDQEFAGARSRQPGRSSIGSLAMTTVGTEPGISWRGRAAAVRRQDPQLVALGAQRPEPSGLGDEQVQREHGSSAPMRRTASMIPAVVSPRRRISAVR